MHRGIGSPHKRMGFASLYPSYGLVRLCGGGSDRCVGWMALFHPPSEADPMHRGIGSPHNSMGFASLYPSYGQDAGQRASRPAQGAGCPSSSESTCSSRACSQPPPMAAMSWTLAVRRVPVRLSTVRSLDRAVAWLETTLL